MMTREMVIQKLGIETENLSNKNVRELIDSVLFTANTLGNVDFAFKEDIAENRVDAGKIIATVYNVAFWNAD